MKSLVRGRMSRTSKPTVLPSGVEVCGIKPQMLIRVKTGSHRMRHPFFYLCRKLGIVVERPETATPELVGSTYDMTEGEALRAEYVRNEYIRDNENWGHEEFFVVYGTFAALSILCDEDFVLSAEAVMDVRPPRGSQPPAMHLPAPRACRENGVPIPTVLQQHPDYKAKALYPQNS